MAKELRKPRGALGGSEISPETQRKLERQWIGPKLRGAKLTVPIILDIMIIQDRL